MPIYDPGDFASVYFRRRSVTMLERIVENTQKGYSVAVERSEE